MASSNLNAFIAGSGKTTLAKAIQTYYPHFQRIPIDEIIDQYRGFYGIDYPASSSLYEQYQTEAESIYLSRFQMLLAQKQDAILERSFYAKEDRERFRILAEEGDARVVLVFLKAEEKEMIWGRICKRSMGKKTADLALDIRRETFEIYCGGFENPVGEGEIVVQVT